MGEIEIPASPVVRVDPKSKLDGIHFARMNHAFAKMIFELSELRNGAVNRVLNRWGIAILPGGGPCVGIEYPSDVQQVLEKELLAEKARLQALKDEAASAKVCPDCQECE